MTFKRVPKGIGRPGIQVTPADLEHVRQLALSGRTRQQIATECGVSLSGWRRLVRRHPALETIISDAYDSIGYEHTVTTRRAKLAEEAEQRDEDPTNVDIETFTTTELEKIHTLSRQGIPPHGLAKRLNLPPAMWAKLWDTDKRGQAVHARGITAAASEVARPPAPLPTPTDTAIPARTAAQVYGLQWQCSILLECEDIEESERANLLGTVACLLCEAERLTETMYKRLPHMTVDDLRSVLATLEPDAATDSDFDLQAALG